MTLYQQAKEDFGLVGKVSDSSLARLRFLKIFFWLPYLEPGNIGVMIGLVGRVSAYCDWPRKQLDLQLLPSKLLRVIPAGT